MSKILLSAVFALGLINSIVAYRILVMYAFPAKSLNILGQGYVRHLLKAGHEVTFVTLYPCKLEDRNLRKIYISDIQEKLLSDFDLSLKNMMDQEEKHDDKLLLQEYALFVAEEAFKSKALRNLLEDTSQSYDAVLADLYETELYSGLSALYECPMIWAYSMGVHWQTLRLIDAPTNPAYTANQISLNIPPFTFLQRIEELWAQIQWGWYKWSNTIPKEKQAYENYFGPLMAKRGKKLPEYTELIYNASLIFGNELQAFGNIPNTPQNFKLVSGIHIEDPVKPLPEDLQTLMDNAKHGVIYFSMGSMWQSNKLPTTTIDELLKMFGELKQTVIWKFEDDLQNLPDNLKIVKWAPQQSILAHPNCRFFITHGGLLSSTEAIYFGVPIIGIPVTFDQFINVKRAETKGYAVTVPLDYELPNNLRTAIETMLKESKYRAVVKELSSIYHDRPIAPGVEAVHWIEHVIRTQGAPHLRSPALNVPFYQKLYLDLCALIILALTLLFCLLRKLLSRKKLKKEKKN